MTKTVFISHSSKDKAIADQICERLEKTGIGCWIAPRDVPAGHSYGEAIVHGIESCAVFLLIWSEHSNNSQPVANEIERASNYQKLIVPLRIREVSASKRIEFFVANTQWIDAFSSPIEDRIEYLASIVRAVETNSPPPPGPSNPKPIQRGFFASLNEGIRKHRIGAALGVVGLSLALASYVHFFNEDQSKKAVESHQTIIEPPSPSPLNKGKSAATSGLTSKIGQWKGTGSQPGSSWEIAINIQSDKQLIEYPDVKCGGILLLVEQSPTRLLFKENITHGGQNCPSGGLIELSDQPDASLAFRYYYPLEGNRLGALGATGTIKRI